MADITYTLDDENYYVLKPIMIEILKKNNRYTEGMSLYQARKEMEEISKNNNKGTIVLKEIEEIKFKF